MFEVKLPQNDKKFQKGEKLIRIRLFMPNEEIEYITYEENVEIENENVISFVDLSNINHRIINTPAIIDYNYDYEPHVDDWQDTDVTDYEDEEYDEEDDEFIVDEDDADPFYF